LVGYNEEKLMNIIRSAKILIVTEEDYTTRKYCEEEIGEIESLGLFGYAFLKDSLYVWIKVNGKYLIKELNGEIFQKMKDRYLHHEVGDPEKKLGEIL